MHKRRKINLPLVEVLVASFVLHLVVLLAVGGVIIHKRYIQEPAEMEAPPVSERPPPPPEIPIKLNELKPKSPAPMKQISVNVDSMDIPTLDLDLPKVSSRISVGSGLGAGRGLGSGLGLSKSAVSFFGMKGESERVLFIVDYSKSMTASTRSKKTRDELMREEFARSVEALPEQMMIATLFFAGPVWEPGPVDEDEQKELVKELQNEWKMKNPPPGMSKWQAFELPNGARPPRWTSLNGPRKRKLIEQINKTMLQGGTTWSLPLELGLSIEPAPDLIFFLTDGAVPKEDVEKSIEIVKEWRKKNPGTKINTVALGEPQAREGLEEIADITGGEYTLIE